MPLNSEIEFDDRILSILVGDYKSKDASVTTGSSTIYEHQPIIYKIVDISLVAGFDLTACAFCGGWDSQECGGKCTCDGMD